MPDHQAGVKNLQRHFVAGLVSLLPLGVTIFVIYFLVNTLGPILGFALRYLPVLRRLPDTVLTVIGFVLLLIVILAIGSLATGAFGGWLLRKVSDFFSRLPLLRGVYGTARQLTDAVLVDRSSLKKVVALEYPRRGMYSLAFLMGDETVTVSNRACSFLFIPATPTPTTGWVHLVPAEDILETSLGVDEALKIFLSAGVVLPDSLIRSRTVCRDRNASSVDSVTPPECPSQAPQPRT